jgi:hypothetical protein
MPAQRRNRTRKQTPVASSNEVIDNDDVKIAEETDDGVPSDHESDVATEISVSSAPESDFINQFTLATVDTTARQVDNMMDVLSKMFKQLPSVSVQGTTAIHLTKLYSSLTETIITLHDVEGIVPQGLAKKTQQSFAKKGGSTKARGPGNPMVPKNPLMEAFLSKIRDVRCSDESELDEDDQFVYNILRKIDSYDGSKLLTPLQYRSFISKFLNATEKDDLLSDIKNGETDPSTYEADSYDAWVSEIYQNIPEGKKFDQTMYLSIPKEAGFYEPSTKR